MIFDGDITFINEEFYADRVTPQQLDLLLANGWRHFGTYFFRYNLGVFESEIRRVIPLRIRLADISLSKSQRRVLRQNSDVYISIRPIELNDESYSLFERHKGRFKSGVPDSIYDFLSPQPSSIPCEALQITVHRDDELIASSYFDVAERSVSAIYGMFDPEQTRRSLGILTMLKVIEFATENGKELYYQGYAYEGKSFYDYKKRFRGTECYDWASDWKAFVAEEEVHRR